ncbi:MAG TPA: NADH:flavin oxidoreductase/NADH oxidase [Spirochaetia bacterium]|nr:NADH:flavin oxidoreductase/NADH oxidase [Spirochaetia bacterium]
MLFTTLALRGIPLRNRIVVSPMCQYSCTDGMATDWHLVHLGSRAVGGAALVMTEATAVEARGRISAADLGIWDDTHVPPLERIAHFIHAQGALAGMQLAHAGRKASVKAPWQGGAPVVVGDGGWEVVGPSAIPFDEASPVPHVLGVEEVRGVVREFARAASRALVAGFQALEIHAAHGYLIHEFLSPISNTRSDAYGGSFDNRIRLLREIVAEIRKRMPESFPLLVRISATDWTTGGWDVEQSVELARRLKEEGVDVIDCSSGGNVKGVTTAIGPGYQTPFAERVRREAQIKTAAVGLITSAQQADHVLRTGQADLVVMARQLLRDPYWPLRAAAELRQEIAWPNQYLRAKA